MYLGLDLGTSELKALLLNEQQHVLATAGAALSVQRPHERWSEQNPDDWWQALERVMDQLRHEHPHALSQLRAIGLSGQMHGAVLMDAHGAVLRPAILWNDGRSADECTWLHAQAPDLRRITGNLAMPGFTAPKLQWVRQHEPALFERLRHVLLPKDWLRWRLTGEFATDLSDASGTLWLDTGRRDWSDRLLELGGLSRDQMPRLLEGTEVSGTVLPAWCQRWQLPATVAVAAGAGDNAASAIGMGLTEPGQGFVSLGTSGVVFVNSAAYDPRPDQALHTFCHALPQRWHQMSVILSAASAVAWATDAMGFAHVSDLLGAAASLSEQEAQQAPVFLPYLNGERSPHNNPQATAAWSGLRASHRRAHLAYAVAEGVGFGLFDGIQTFPDQGRSWVALSLVGGGSRSEWWAQTLADTFGLTLQVQEAANHGGALGAARLACISQGASIAEVCTSPPTLRTHTPQPERHQRLLERHALFQRRYADDPAQAALRITT